MCPPARPPRGRLGPASPRPRDSNLSMGNSMLRLGEGVLARSRVTRMLAMGPQGAA